MTDHRHTLSGASPGFHTTALLIWLLAALLPTLLTRNPVYLTLIIVVMGLNYRGLGRPGSAGEGWRGFLWLAAVMAGFSILFNILFVSAGATTLFTLPELRLQPPLGQAGQMTVLHIGGRVTLESLVYGLSVGLSLLALLLTFAVFNLQVDHYQLLRGLPRFLYQSAVVVSIAITFIPAMFTAQREIRQAQTLRGHRFRGLRDLTPLFVALLAEGLERSLTLAESMEARGFSRADSPAAEKTGLLLKALLALGLLALLAGALAWSYFAANRLIGGGLMAGGLLVILLTLHQVGRQVHRSRYRRDRPHRGDTLLAAASIVSGLLTLTVWLAAPAALVFYPYPRLDWPPFHPAIAAAAALLAAPGLIARTRLMYD